MNECNFEHFKIMLHEALQDPSIQNKIREIYLIEDSQKKNEDNMDVNEPVRAAQPEEIQRQISALRMKLEQTEGELAAVSRKRMELEVTNQSLTQKIQELNTANQGLTQKVRDLNATNQNLVQEIQELNAAKEAAEQHCITVQEELRSLKNDVKAKAELYQVFDEVVAIFQEYVVQPAEIVSEATRIVCAESADLFYATGCQKENVLALWDFMKSEWDRLDDAGKTIFLKMLDFFIRAINKQYQKPVYQLMDCACGDMFDDRLHIRTADSSRYSGRIVQVCLPGIRNIYKGETIIRKSLVLVQ